MPALEKAFELAVVISAVDHWTGPVQKIAGQMGILEKQTAAVQKRMAQFKAMTLTGAAITGVGALMAAGLDKAVTSAGQLQTAMMGVKDAMKLTNDQYQRATNMAQTIGIPTIFSSVQVGGIMKSMSQAGLSNKQVLDPSILKQYVNFADVQAQMKNANPNDVVAAGVRMAHEYRLYSAAQIKPFLNQVNAALLHTNGTPDEFATTYRYVAQQSKLMGMNSSATLSATAWLDRMGFGNGRGGTNFADFLRRSIYGSSGKKADAAMVQAGFVQNGHSVFENANGKFVGIPAAVKILQDFAARFHNNANQMSPLLNSIFGTQGARIAMMMASKGAGEQYTNVQKQIAATASISQSQQDLNNTWAGKVKQLQTTLQDIGQAFGKSVMPVLLPLVKTLDDILGKVLKFEQQHPKIMKFISVFASIATAVLLVIGPLMTLTGVLGYLATSNALRMGLIILGRSFTGMLGPVGTITVAAYALYQAWTHNWGGIQQKTHGVIAAIKADIGPFLSMMNKVLQVLGIEQISHKTVGLHGNSITGADGNPLTKVVRSFKIPTWVKWTAGVLLGTKALTGMFGVTTRVIGSLNSFVGVFSKLSSLPGLLLRFVAFIGRITGVTKLWTAAQAVFNAVADANPISLIIIGVVALSAVVILLITHWKKVVQWLKHAWQWYKNLGDNIKLLLAIFVPFVGLPALIISKWGAIKTFFSDLWNNYLKPVIDGIANSSIGKWVMNHIFGVKSMPPTSSTSGAGGINIPTGAMSASVTNSSTSNQITIHVNGAGDPEAVANHVIKKLGTHTRMNNMSRPAGPNRLVFSH